VKTAYLKIRRSRDAQVCGSASFWECKKFLPRCDLVFPK